MSCPNLRPANDKPCISYIKGGMCERVDEFMCIEYLKSHLPHISHSAAQSFARCKMLYYWQYVRRIQLRDEYRSDALKMGTLWDSLLTGSIESFNEKLKTTSLNEFNRARMNGLMRAAVELIDLDYYQAYEQQHIDFYHQGDYVVKCIYDLWQTDHFAEVKLSSKPERYLDIERIGHQVGMYLLANHKAEYVDMLVTKTPAQKSKKDETAEEFEERIYQDVMDSPRAYFIGYNESCLFGTRFYRHEFNLDLIRQFYVNTIRDLHLTIEHDTWYCNECNCFGEFGACDYYSIKKTGNINEMIYRLPEHKNLK